MRSVVARFKVCNGGYEHSSQSLTGHTAQRQTDVGGKAKKTTISKTNRYNMTNFENKN